MYFDSDRADETSEQNLEQISVLRKEDTLLISHFIRLVDLLEKEYMGYFSDSEDVVRQFKQKTVVEMLEEIHDMERDLFEQRRWNNELKNLPESLQLLISDACKGQTLTSRIEIKREFEQLYDKAQALFADERPVYLEQEVEEWRQSVFMVSTLEEFQEKISLLENEHMQRLSVWEQFNSLDPDSVSGSYNAFIKGNLFERKALLESLCTDRPTEAQIESADAPQEAIESEISVAKENHAQESNTHELTGANVDERIQESVDSVTSAVSELYRRDPIVGHCRAIALIIWAALHDERRTGDSTFEERIETEEDLFEINKELIKEEKFYDPTKNDVEDIETVDMTLAVEDWQSPQASRMRADARKLRIQGHSRRSLLPYKLADNTWEEITPRQAIDQFFLQSGEELYSKVADDVNDGLRIAQQNCGLDLSTQVDNAITGTVELVQKSICEGKFGKS